jgi:phosphohistidine phosphatase SixA
MNFLFYACRLKWLPDFKPVAIACIVLLLSIGVGATASPSENDFKITTVFLVRHAEKATTPPEDPPLLESGNRRAQELGRILMKAGIKAIYTSQYLRTKQTAEPLAKNLGIESKVVRIGMSAKNPREISQESMKEIAEKVYERAGENALIVGHSNTIPEVIKALGGDVVPTIDEKEYGDLFVVTVYAKGKAKVTHLKYGDEK